MENKVRNIIKTEKEDILNLIKRRTRLKKKALQDFNVSLKFWREVNLNIINWSD